MKRNSESLAKAAVVLVLSSKSQLPSWIEGRGSPVSGVQWQRYQLVNVVKLTVLASKRKLYSLYFSIMFVLVRGARVVECAELE